MNTEVNVREFDEALPLVLTSVSGQVLWSFPSEVIENLRGMVNRISLNRISKKGDFPVRLSLAAARRREGVTYVSQALAAIIANDLSTRVCLVDLNWWWPSSTPLVASDSPGLSGVLAGKAQLNDVIVPTGWPNLSFVPAGKLAKQDRPIIAHSQALNLWIDELGARFDHLILDVPAILETNDAVSLASLGEACCLVVRQGETQVNDLQSALDEINHLTVMGVIVNRVKLLTPPWIVKLLS